MSYGDGSNADKSIGWEGEASCRAGMCLKRFHLTQPLQDILVGWRECLRIEPCSV